MRRAYSYIRFSSNKQEKGDSVKRQTKLAVEWCRSRPEVILDESLDMSDLKIPAFEGRNLTEGKLAAFIAAIKSGRVTPGSVLLIEQLDRFSRADIDVALPYFCQILRSGVNIVTLRSGKEYSAASIGSNDIIMAVFELVLAHDESAKKSERVKAAWQRKRDSAAEVKLTANTHRWLKLAKDRKSFTVVADKAAIINQIFTLASDGWGVKAISKKLNTEGVKAIGDGAKWHSSYIYKILTDRAVLGEFQRHKKEGRKDIPLGDPVPDYFPRVVTDELWYRAHSSMKTRHKGAGRKGINVANLFTKILFDARDGTPLNALSKGYEALGRKYKVLVSSGAYRGLAGSEYTTFPYDYFETNFLQFVTELRASDVTSGSSNGIESRMAVLSGKLAEIDQKITKLKKAIEVDSDIDSLISSLTTQERKKKEIAKELEELRAKSSSAGETEVLGETQSIITMLANATGDDLTALRTKLKGRIAQLVQSIWILVSIKEKVRKTAKVGKYRTALVQVYLRNGQIRQFYLDTEHKFGVGEIHPSDQILDDLPNWRFGRPELKSAMIIDLAAMK